MKTEKIRVEAGIRAQKYEERSRKEGKNKIIKECWNQIKNRKEERRSRWEKEREAYYKRNGMDLEQVEKVREEEREIGIMLREADVKEQIEEQYERITNSRYNQRYRELYTITKPMYLTAQYKGRDQKLIARFRCGNEERRNKYWKNEQDKRCRLCMDTEESIDHLASNCRSIGKTTRTIHELLSDTGEGADWMRKIINRRKEKEQESEDQDAGRVTIGARNAAITKRGDGNH